MERVISTQVQDEDIKIRKNLRPQTLDDYIGQQKAEKNLKVYIDSKTAWRIFGLCPVFWTSGLSKTTLSIIAVDKAMKITSGPAIGKPGGRRQS